MRIGRENEVLRDNLPQFYFLHHKSHMTWPELDLGLRGGKPATNRLSYGTVSSTLNQNTLIINIIDFIKSLISVHMNPKMISIAV
jgi:hypothetical protein